MQWAFLYVETLVHHMYLVLVLFCSCGSISFQQSSHLKLLESENVFYYQIMHTVWGFDWLFLLFDYNSSKNWKGMKDQSTISLVFLNISVQLFSYIFAKTCKNLRKTSQGQSYRMSRYKLMLTYYFVRRFRTPDWCPFSISSKKLDWSTDSTTPPFIPSIYKFIDYGCHWIVICDLACS